MTGVADATIFAIFGASAGETRVPGMANCASGVAVRMTIQPSPLLYGRVNGPTKGAPAASSSVSPGWAAAIAALRSPPALTEMILPDCVGMVVSTVACGSICWMAVSLRTSGQPEGAAEPPPVPGARS